MPKAKPRIEVLGPEAIPVGWTHNAVTHVNTFHEDPEGNQTGVILYFRNLAIYGEEIGSVRGAKARLHVYRDAQEIGKGFGASWLGTSGFAVDLISGGDTKGIPLLLKNERDEYSTPWTKISTAVYPPSIYSRFELYDEPPTGFTVILLDSNDQTIIPVITIQLEDADKLLYRRS